jgi:hypothetical protein
LAAISTQGIAKGAMAESDDQELPPGARAVLGRFALTVRSDLQQLDGAFQEQIADAGWPANIELIKKYCVERFEICAESLLFTTVSTEPTMLNPQYEQFLEASINKTRDFLSKVLCNLPAGTQSDLSSWINIKLGGRKKWWLGYAGKRHLEHHPVRPLDAYGAEAPLETKSIASSLPTESAQLSSPKEIIDAFCALNSCSLDGLADKAGVDRRQVFKIRNGKPVRSFATAAVAEVLQVEPAALIPKARSQK